MNEQCVICELEEMLDDTEMSNDSLREENNELKDLLIGALLDLNEYQAEYIESLEDELDFLEPLEEDLDICCCCGE